MKISTLLFSTFLIFSCGGNSEQQLKEENWYVGGTLHQSTLQDWANANDKDKLATCADFVANVKDYQGDMGKMKEDATIIMNCIDELAKESTLENEKSAEMAATCFVTQGLNH